MNKSGNQNKKSRRGSPTLVQETSPISQHSNQDAVLALKSLLSMPVQVKKEDVSTMASPPPADALLALKTILAVPPKAHTPERPKAEAVQALKSLLLSPVHGEDSPQSEPASFQALKTMLMSGKKEVAVVEEGKAGTGKTSSGKKRSSSPKQTNNQTSAKVVTGKVTPPRSEKKKKQKGPGAAGSAGKPAFAGSLFQSSPDPIAMPMPDFDEAQSSFFADSFEEEQHSPVAAAPIDPLNSLRMMLKIPA